jgi:hypothetical protein
MQTIAKLQVVLVILMLTACGGGGGGGGSAPAPSAQTGQFIDSPVGGLTYSCTSGSSTANTGTTNAQGQFTFTAGQTCTFKIGNVTIGSMSNIPTDGVVTPQDVAGVSRSATSDPTAVAIAQLLQTLDDGTGNGNIVIPASVTTALSSSSVSPLTLASSTAGVVPQNTLASLVQTVGQSVPAYSSKTLVSAGTATSALQAQITSGKVNASTGAVNSNSPVTLTSIVVTSTASSNPAGISEQLTATGNYSDGTTKDLTSKVTWSSSDTSILTVDSTGNAVGVAKGSAVVTASIATAGSTASVNGTFTQGVTDPTILNIVIATVSNAVQYGATTTLTAIETFSNNVQKTISSLVDWVITSITGNGTVVVDKTANTATLTGTVSGATSVVANYLGLTSNSLDVTVGANPCVLKSYNSTPPNTYMGIHTIPTATSKFDTGVQRGIGLKDYYPGGEKNGCATNADYARLLYIKTLDKLVEDGVDVVEIYEYGPVNDLSAAVWTLDESRWQIPKNELKWFVDTAHSKNLKVSLAWQLWPVDTNNNNITSYDSATMPEAELIRILRGWHNVIKYMATLSKNFNIDILNVQWNAFYFPEVLTYPESSVQEFISIIDDIRTVYSGKLYMGTPRFYDRRIIQKVDAIIVPLTPTWPWTHTDDTNMSVSLLKQRYADQINAYYSDFVTNTGMNPNDIPIIWDFNIQSRDKALSDGWVEDGFCITQINGSPTSFDDPLCMQKNYVTDFSVQAQAVEGAFEAIKDQNVFKTYGINFSTGYWLTDTIVSGTEGFPNLSQSIRGKPAETIVKQWYKR